MIFSFAQLACLMLDEHCPEEAWPRIPTKDVPTHVKTQLRSALDITLQYLNHTKSKEDLRVLRRKAKVWAALY